jgi:hypothetical protein
MPLQSTDTHGVLEAAFFDELSKIAEEQGDRWITKDKLKKLVTTVVPAAALGTGAGYATGKAIDAYARRKVGRLSKNPKFQHLAKVVGSNRIRRYGPVVGGVSGAALGMILMMKAHKVKKALESKNERS